MSLEPRNIVVDGPDVFGNAGSLTFGEPSGVDAPPFYSSFSGALAMSGSYYGAAGTAYEDIEYDFNGISMATQELERIGLRDPLLGLTAFEIRYEINRNTDPNAFIDIGGANALADGKCIACCAFRGAPSGQFVPLSVPWFQSAGNPSFDPDAGVGVRRDHSNDPPTESDILVNASFIGPSFTGTIGESDFRMKFSVRVTFFTESDEINSLERNFNVEVDVSSWTTLDFRDIRGTYGTTSTDPNSIEYAWSVTIG